MMPTFWGLAGLLLILAVDHFLDMGRTATNVIGNAVASAVIGKWEGGLDAREPVVGDLPGDDGSRVGPGLDRPDAHSFREIGRT